MALDGSRASVVGGMTLVVSASLLVPALLLSAAGLFDASVILSDVIFAVGVSFAIGIAGVPSFGNQLFFGAAAYTVAELATRYGIHDDILFLIAGLSAGIVLAVASGWALGRLQGLTFGMATLAVGQLAYIFVYQTSFLGGANGIAGVPLGSILGVIQISSPRAFYVLSWIIAAVCVLALALTSRSHFGQTLRAIRDSPRRSRSLGIPVHRYRIIGYVIGAAASAAAGVLAAISAGTVDPSLLYWTAGAIPVLAGLVGGIATVEGPIVGGLIFGVITIYVSTYTRAWLLISGVLALAMYLAWPEGLFGRVRYWGLLQRQRKQAASDDEVRPAGEPEAAIE